MAALRAESIIVARQASSRSRLSPSQQFLLTLSRNLLRQQGLPVWVLLVAVLLLLLSWNWQLVLATVAGIVVMGAVYIAQDWDGRAIAATLQHFASSPSRPLVVAVGTGTTAALVVRMAAALWANASNRWVGAAEVLQLLSAVAIAAIAAKFWLDRLLQQDRQSFERALERLTDANDLSRLMAMQHILACVRQKRFPLGQESAIAEYCRLLLERETVPAVREAAYSTLEALPLGDRSIPFVMHHTQRIGDRNHA